MPHHEGDGRYPHQSDDEVDAILSGSWPPGDAYDPVAEAVRDLRYVAVGPPPAPSPELARVLVEGLSTAAHPAAFTPVHTDKGTPLVTAARNVHGPAQQVAGLPKWRNHNAMFPIGLLSGLVPKILASIAAALVGVTAVGAAGALPGPTQNLVATAVEAVTPFGFPGGEGSASVVVGSSSAEASAEIGLGLPDAAAVAAAAAQAAQAAQAAASNVAGAAQAAAGPSGALVPPTIAGLNLPIPSGPPSFLPDLSSLPIPLPALRLPACLSGILDPLTGQPLVALSGVSAQVTACVGDLIAQGAVPAAVAPCLSQVLAVVGQVGPSAAPALTSFAVPACAGAGVDVSACMSSVFGIVETALGGGVPGLGLLDPAALDLSGCVPFNLDLCLGSMLAAIPSLPGGGPGAGAGLGLDLSACVPFGPVNGLLSTVPGLGGGLGALQGLIPGFGGLFAGLDGLLPGLGVIPGLDIVGQLGLFAGLFAST